MPEETAVLDSTPAEETYASVKANIGTSGYGVAPAKEDNGSVADGGGDPADKIAGESAKPEDKQSAFEKRKAQIQKEIDAQVARRIKAKEEADAEEARLTKLKGNEQPRKDPEVKASDGTDPSDARPTQDKFTDYDEWRDAVTRWEARKEFRRLQAEADTRKQADQTKAAQESNKKFYDQSVIKLEVEGEKFSEDHPEFPELLGKFKEQKISNELEAFLLWGLDGQDQPAMLYELAKNPDKLKELDDPKKSPMQRFSGLYAMFYNSKVAALEAKIAELENEPEPKKSKAQPAGTTLKGAGAPAAQTIDTATNWKAFKNRWDKDK